MRGFAQTLFNVLLGWIRTVVEGVWNLLFSSGTQAWLQWIADNWLTVVLLLCLAGVFMDFFIWFLRWRPYYVWATSIRHIRRFFGGRRGREENVPLPPAPSPAWENAPPAYADRQPPPYMQEPPDETVRYGQDTPADTMVAGCSAPPPNAPADTIYARPRKADYQEQYVRRFARPEPELIEIPDAEEPPEYAQEPAAEYPQYSAGPPPDEYPEYAEEEPEGMRQEEWAPEAPPVPEELPLHPGIDYQALSRQYGWHAESAEPAVPKADPPVKAPQAQPSPAWDFSGLKSFAPYSAPAPSAAKGQRSQRAQKAREGATPVNKMKTGLQRIVKKAGKALTVDDEENTLLDGLPPPIDKRRAFHAPVYPNRPDGKSGKSPDFREDD